MLECILSADLSLLRFFNSGNSVYFDALVPMLTSGLTWIPLYIALFYLVVKNHETMAQIGLIVATAVVCVCLAGGIGDFIVKPMVGSFFSSHAANTFSLAMFFSLLVRDRLFTIVMFLWALLNCWTRLYLGVHYPSDILCGMLYGSFVGVVVYLAFYKLFYKFNIKFQYISSQYTASGYAKADIDVVVATLVFTIAIVALLAFGDISI